MQQRGRDLHRGWRDVLRQLRSSVGAPSMTLLSVEELAELRRLHNQPRWRVAGDYVTPQAWCDECDSEHPCDAARLLDTIEALQGALSERRPVWLAQQRAKGAS